MLSILIVNWNTRDHLRRCLASIQAHPPEGEWEVIVIDNASPDGSAEMVEAEFGWVRLHKAGRNLGYAAGSNAAFSMSEGPLLLTLNPDTQFMDSSLDTAVRIMTERTGVGALAGKLLNEDGTVQPSLRSFPRPGPVLWDLLGFARLFPNSRTFGAYRQTFFDYQTEAEVEQPMGTFILYRREAVFLAGTAGVLGEDARATFAPMDENFPIFFNEVDLLYRLTKAGWKVLYTPDVKVIHHGGASTKQVRKAMIWESHRSLSRFYWKWYLRWWSWPLLVVFHAVVWVAALVRARGWSAGFRGA